VYIYTHIDIYVYKKRNNGIFTVMSGINGSASQRRNHRTQQDWVVETSSAAQDLQSLRDW
jgi:hypothetical protein